MEWFNEPRQWAIHDHKLTVTADGRTDFWRKTHYGFVRDSGHFYYQTVSGDFAAEVKFIGRYASLYDQAGMMVRVDEKNWIKTGIEWVDGRQFASAVVTRDHSDWSVLPLPDNPVALWLRVTREGSCVTVRYSADGERFELLRLAYLPFGETAQVGLMCAAPEGDGFMTTFEDFKIGDL